jgi:hypothetical protein
MGPNRNPRREQKWTEGYVIVSTCIALINDIYCFCSKSAHLIFTIFTVNFHNFKTWFTLRLRWPNSTYFSINDYKTQKQTEGYVIVSTCIAVINDIYCFCSKSKLGLIIAVKLYSRLWKWVWLVLYCNLIENSSFVIVNTLSPLLLPARVTIRSHST